MKNKDITIIHVFNESIFIDYIIEQFIQLEYSSRFFV